MGTISRSVIPMSSASIPDAK
ncbi:hypothetical protein RB2654_14040 [Rhodobacterales bacterium HTCC2654]|uniref:Uncharacterized protein n=1 Tax=Maritimibacter alkaliphilus HTCC2654 TaxID=314271 RepID=A3VGK7_9RHOB|nr:hypothetical protein RB2654_14040 [Rhodobacterales bacterium HTCC2654] [Maritimibacter alkaliphilus HTCC2654]